MRTTHPIRFGIQTGQQNIAWSDMLGLWRQADAWGYDSLWNFDHFYPIFTNPEGDCLEGWTTLSALAQATHTARIGHLVTGNTYRHPAVLAKMAATLDHISNGRLNLGLGAGWFELEHKSLGIDFKDVPQRLAAFEESLQIVKGMFTQDKTTLHGTHYQVTDAMGLPKPVQRPHPPILIGGEGKRVLLRLVAQYADMWNAFKPADGMRELIEIIARHGEKVGRDTSVIEKTVMMPLCYKGEPAREQFSCAVVAGIQQTTPENARQSVMIGGTDECFATIDRYARAGVTHFIFMLLAPYHQDELQAFAEEVIPAVRNRA